MYPTNVDLTSYNLNDFSFFKEEEVTLLPFFTFMVIDIIKYTREANVDI